MSERTWHGKHFLYVSCSGLMSSWSHCFEQAERSCGVENYEVIAQSNWAKDDEGGYPFGLNPAGFSSRDAVILCDPPKHEHQRLSRRLLRHLRSR